MPTHQEKRPLAAAVARKWLGALARRIQTGLTAYELDIYRARPRLGVSVSPNTEGWFVHLGDILLPGTEHVSVYLDRVPADGAYHVWTGFLVSGEARAIAIGRHLRRHVGPPFVVRDSDFGRQGGYTQMTRPLKVERYGRPAIELFARAHKCFGIYPPHSQSYSNRPPERLALQATRFLAQALSALGSWHYGTVRSPPLKVPIVEGRVSGQAFRRDPRQARAAKERDSYMCRICTIKPELIYGADGRACLEAHHIDALHARSRKVSRLDRLITVCANCHRVLGRLDPSERGLSELRRRFSRARRS